MNPWVCIAVGVFVYLVIGQVVYRLLFDPDEKTAWMIRSIWPVLAAVFVFSFLIEEWAFVIIKTGDALAEAWMPSSSRQGNG